MALKSDLALDASKFDPAAVSKATRALNAELEKVTQAGPKWYETGAEKYRQMRWNGETAFPKPIVLDAGKKKMLPSRDAGRDIPCRVFVPEHGAARGVYFHIHGGGWVLQSEEYQDSLLKFTADCAQLAVVSVGYRLAPEDPFPAGPEDCFDVAEWLVDHSKEELGAGLLFVGGESAGGHLSVVTILHLIKSRPAFEFKGAVLNFGCYDLAGLLPQAHHWEKPLVLDRDIMTRYIDAFVPNSSVEARRDPSISPFFANLPVLAASTPSGKLPPALFTVGTEDVLLDDTVLFCTKWMMSGSEAILRVYPGAVHGFIVFPPEMSDTAADGRKDIEAFLLEKLK